ncbi:hypothetical protein PMAYCL1PPCAC_01874, partial [Pristionchus mayeri]
QDLRSILVTAASPQHSAPNDCIQKTIVLGSRADVAAGAVSAAGGGAARRPLQNGKILWRSHGVSQLARRFRPDVRCLLSSGSSLQRRAPLLINGDLPVTYPSSSPSPDSPLGTPTQPHYR